MLVQRSSDQLEGQIRNANVPARDHRDRSTGESGEHEAVDGVVAVHPRAEHQVSVMVSIQQ